MRGIPKRTFLTALLVLLCTLLVGCYQAVPKDRMAAMRRTPRIFIYDLPRGRHVMLLNPVLKYRFPPSGKIVTT